MIRDSTKLNVESGFERSLDRVSMGRCAVEQEMQAATKQVRFALASLNPKSPTFLRESEVPHESTPSKFGPKSADGRAVG